MRHRQQRKIKMRTNKKSLKRRTGALTVEMAIVLPVILVFFFGLWEWSRVEMIRQVSETAAFESARLGTLPGATATDMETHATNILSMYLISAPEITASVDDVDSQVLIEVPFDQNTWISSRIFAGKSAISEMQIKK